ncbi:MAG: CvpA family protein [Candidatus Saccharibacteria bacterium]
MDLNALDWILLLVILIAAVSGFRKGFIKCLGGVVAVIAGTLCALAFWDPVTMYLQDNYQLITLVSEKITPNLTVPAFDSIEGLVPSLFDSVQYAYQGLAYHVARLLVSAGIFILLAFLVGLFVRFLWRLLDMIFEWGILGAANKISGLVFEVTKAVLIMTLTIGLANPVIAALARTQVPQAVSAQGYINGSFLVPYLESLYEIMGRISGINKTESEGGSTFGNQGR